MLHKKKIFLLRGIINLNIYPNFSQRSIFIRNYCCNKGKPNLTENHEHLRKLLKRKNEREDSFKLLARIYNSNLNK